VLFYRGWRELLLQIVHESRDMERLDLCELVNVFGGAPVGKAAGRVDIGPSRMSVVDLSREKLKEASRGFSRRCEQWRRPAPPSQTDDIESAIDASCDKGYLSSWRSD